MAINVPPMETRRKPRNSAISFSTFDDFMNPIVAGEAGWCLGTLVPIWGWLGERQASRSARPATVLRHNVAIGD